MQKSINQQKYERKVTGAERFFMNSPFSTVTMVARIKGNVTEEMLRMRLTKSNNVMRFFVCALKVV